MDRWEPAHIVVAALAVVVALGVGLAASSRAFGYIAQRLDAREMQYKPRRIEASRDDTFRISRVAWKFKRYGNDVAPGTGIAVTTDCAPDCASSLRVRYKVKFKVSQPRRYCGRLFYTYLRMMYVSDKPDYASRVREQSLAPVTDC